MAWTAREGRFHSSYACGCAGTLPRRERPRDLADRVVAVLSEALTNVARHAQADRADVVLETDGREVRLTVTDGAGNRARWPTQRSAQHGRRAAGREPDVAGCRERRPVRGVEGAAANRRDRDGAR